MIDLVLCRYRECSPAGVRRLAERLPRERAERISRLHREQDRRAGILVHGLMAHLWREREGAPMPAWSRRPGGKPWAPNAPDQGFSLSHDAEHGACALARRELGVDVQGPVGFDAALFSRIATRREADLLPRFRMTGDLSVLWTRKEARVKCSGAGLRADLRTVDTGPCPELLTVGDGPGGRLRCTLAVEREPGLRAELVRLRWGTCDDDGTWWLRDAPGLRRAASDGSWGETISAASPAVLG